MGAFANHVGRAGYGLLQSPMFEDLGVFKRMGEGTDVVRKEMYDFIDRGGDHVALRPEGTASAVRAFNQHHPQPPWKIWYAAPSFRYERPQKGRIRQHHQIGIEAIGATDPDLDVEVIATLWDFHRSLGLERIRLLINSMGDFEGRARYLEELRTYLRSNADALDPDDREKISDFPMRVLDSKRPGSQGVVVGAPKLIDHLTPEADQHFDRVQAGLSSLAIPFEIEPNLVRGLDYYTHTTFEVQSDAIEAAQSTIGGGGRYDGLAEALGGDPAPGIGFGSGIERLILACDAEGVFERGPQPLDAFVVDVTGGAAARDLTAEIRRAGLSADRAWGGRSMKAQMKAANRSGATSAVIVGEDEAERGVVVIRPLRTDQEQREVPRAVVIGSLIEIREDS